MIEKLSDILVVCDLDGTLLTAKEGIPSCNVEMIRLFCAMGGRFTVATGRSVDSVSRYLDEIELSAPAILYNGGLLYDFNSKKVVRQSFLPEEAKKAFTRLCHIFPEVGAEIMPESLGICVTRASEYTYRHTQDEKLPYALRDLESAEGRWFKALFASTPAQQALLAQKAAGLSGEGYYFVSTGPVYYELMPRGVSKGTGLQNLCDYLNLPLENTVAIGDYYNDVEMLDIAGRSAAVENAPQDVKQHAAVVIPSCTDGGVAQFLYQLVSQYKP